MEHRLLAFFLMTGKPGLTTDIVNQLKVIDSLSDVAIVKANNKSRKWLIKQLLTKTRTLEGSNQNTYLARSPLAQLINQRRGKEVSESAQLLDLASGNDLVQFKAVVDKDGVMTNWDGFKVLHFWVMGGDEDIFNYIVSVVPREILAALLVEQGGQTGLTPFMFAVANGKSSQARRLLELASKQVLCTTKTGANVFHVWSIAADPAMLGLIAYHVDDAMVMSLLEAKRNDGHTPLTLAKLRGNDAFAVLTRFYGANSSVDKHEQKF